MSKKSKDPTKSKANRKKTLALRFYLGNICLEYLRHRGNVRATAKALAISPHTLYGYMELPEWNSTMETASNRLNDEMARAIVMQRELIDRRTIEKLDSWMDDPEGVHDNPYCRLTHTAYESLSLVSSVKTVNANSAQAAAIVGAPPPNLPHLYQSPWRKSVLEAQTINGPEHQLGAGVEPGQRPATSIPE